MAQEEFRTAFRRYTVVRQLGQGGAGRVFEVHGDDGARCALKLLNPESLTSDRVRRFHNEIAFCQRRVHAGIVHVQDVGFKEDSGQNVPFYVMPLYERTLRQLMIEGIDATRAINLFMQIVDAVSAAHAHGVSHRDLKPENILISAEGGAVVADFGIARFEDASAATLVSTRAGVRLANFQYAAPEQRARNAEVTNLADVYSPGLIGQELLTGEIPLGEGAKSVLDSNPEFGFMDAILQAMRQQSPSNRPSLPVVVEQIRSRLPVKDESDQPEAGKNHEIASSSILLRRAAQLGAKFRHEKARKQFFSSQDGVDRVKLSFNAIRGRLQELAAELNQELPFTLTAKGVGEFLEVKAEGLAAVPRLRLTYANVLDGVKIRFTIWRGDANLPGRMFFDKPEEIVNLDFFPDLDAGDTVVWRDGDSSLKWRDDGVISENDVATQMLMSFLGAIDDEV